MKNPRYGTRILWATLLVILGGWFVAPASARLHDPDVELDHAIEEYLALQFDSAQYRVEQILSGGPPKRLEPSCYYLLGMIHFERALIALDRIVSPAEAVTNPISVKTHLRLAAEDFLLVVRDGDPDNAGVERALLCKHGPNGLRLAIRASFVLKEVLRLYRFGLDVPDDGNKHITRLLHGTAQIAAARKDNDLVECQQAIERLRLAARQFDTVGQSSHILARGLDSYVSHYDEERRWTDHSYAFLGVVQEPIERAWSSFVDWASIPEIGSPLFDLRFVGGGLYAFDPLLPGRQVDLSGDDDFAFSLNGSLDVSWDLANRTYEDMGSAGWNSLIVGVGYTSRNRWYDEEDDALDYNDHEGRAYVRWLPEALSQRSTGTQLGLEYAYVNSQAGQRDLFETHLISPDVTLIWNWEDYGEGYPREALDRTRLHATFGFRDDRGSVDDLVDNLDPQPINPNASPEDLDRDGRFTSIGVEHYGYLGRARDLPWLRKFFDARPVRECEYHDQYLRYKVGAGAILERVDGREYDRTLYVADASISVPLWYRFGMDAGVDVLWGDYRHGSAFDPNGDPRDEFRAHGTLGLSYRLAKLDTYQSRVRLAADFIHQESDVDVYDYDRAIYSLQFEMAFGPKPRKGPDYTKRKDWLNDDEDEDDPTEDPSGSSDPLTN